MLFVSGQVARSRVEGYRVQGLVLRAKRGYIGVYGEWEKKTETTSYVTLGLGIYTSKKKESQRKRTIDKEMETDFTWWFVGSRAKYV